HDRAEDFLALDLHAMAHLVKYRDIDKATLAHGFARRMAATAHHTCAFVAAGLDIPHDPLVVRARDHGPHLAGLELWRPYGDLVGQRHHRVHKILLDRSMDKHTRIGPARLALRAGEVHACHSGSRNAFNIDVRIDDERVFPAQLKAKVLDAGLLGNGAPRFHAAGKGD